MSYISNPKPIGGAASKCTTAQDSAPDTTAANPHVDQPLGVPHSRKPPLPFTPPSDPSSRDSSPAKFSFSGPDLLSPSSANSRRGSQQSYDPDSRRGSAKCLAIDAMKDMRKGVKKVTVSTVEAGHKVVDTGKQIKVDVEATTKKVKDKTASVSTTVKSATKDAGKWMATQSSKKAKAAMDQARSHLSCSEKFTLYAADKISILSRRGFTHIFMFLMMVVYTAIGAALFMVVEGSHEEKYRKPVVKIDTNSERTRLIFTLWNDTTDMQEFDEFKSMAHNLITVYEEQLHHNFKVGEGPHTKVRDWTFWKAMFFCSSISTTIGYGNFTPQTKWGQTLTIVYALIGIPLFLILLADFGKLFTRLLKQMFILWAKVKKSNAYKRARAHHAVQRVTGRLRFITDILSCNWGQSDDDDDDKDPKNPEDYFTDGNFNLPVSLALGILGLYIFIGSLLFTIWEDWTTFEAFYFIFISMTTIGFGDYVPKHAGFMMAATVYLVFGLALTAMSINIIQEKLTDTFNKASVKLKDSFKNVMSSMHTEDDDDDDDGNEEDNTYAEKNGTNIVLNVENCS